VYSQSIGGTQGPPSSPIDVALEIVGLKGASVSLLYADTDTFSVLDGFGSLFAY
jgi:hypothetical protein